MAERKESWFSQHGVTREMLVPSGDGIFAGIPPPFPDQKGAWFSRKAAMARCSGHSRSFGIIVCSTEGCDGMWINSKVRFTVEGKRCRKCRKVSLARCMWVSAVGARPHGRYKAQKKRRRKPCIVCAAEFGDMAMTTTRVHRRFGLGVRCTCGDLT